MGISYRATVGVGMDFGTPDDNEDYYLIDEEEIYEKNLFFPNNWDLNYYSYEAQGRLIVYVPSLTGTDLYECSDLPETMTYPSPTEIKELNDFLKKLGISYPPPLKRQMWMLRL